jgi:hypothetical protein
MFSRRGSVSGSHADTDRLFSLNSLSAVSNPLANLGNWVFGSLVILLSGE